VLGWLTPDEPADRVYVIRRLKIPAELVRHVTGALSELTELDRWEEFGSMTPDAAVQLAEVLLADYAESTSWMIGQVVMLAGELPDHVLLCNGASYQRLDYPALYDALDAQYRTDADNFTVPDLRDRFVVGAAVSPDLGNYNLGDVGGSADHALSVAELPSHTHGSHVHTPDVDVEGPAGVPTPAPGLTAPAQTGAAGSGTPHENRPPYYALVLGIIAR